MAVIDSHPLRGAFVANLLERLSGLISAQGEDLLGDAGLEFPPRAVSTILLLGERGDMSAADLAKMIDRPHQLVTQRVDLLIELGLVSRVADPYDARRRILRLTPKGRRQFQGLQTRLAEAKAAFEALWAEIGCDLPDAVLKAMAALERSPLAERVKDVETTKA